VLRRRLCAGWRSARVGSFWVGEERVGNQRGVGLKWPKAQNEAWFINHTHPSQKPPAPSRQSPRHGLVLSLRRGATPAPPRRPRPQRDGPISRRRFLVLQQQQGGATAAGADTEPAVQAVAAGPPGHAPGAGDRAVGGAARKPPPFR
jgi:hypothetical protein